MCGIVGIWNMDGQPVPKGELERFMNTLVHRGPDNWGTFFDEHGSLGLGHRRLSILDLTSEGKQPMLSGHGRFCITYNGEIYNYVELRRELEALGYRFHTDTDTEVLLAAYSRWGLGCQNRLNGMWAFAIWDRQEKELVISRDRYSVKPLHYCFDGRRFAFASELKAFLVLKWLPLDFSSGYLATSISSSVALDATADTLLHRVKRLPGGHYLLLRSGRNPQIVRWWNTLDHLTAVPGTLSEQAERFVELFSDACRVRMRSDAPVGFALSGGLDSSAVVCVTHDLKESFETAGRATESSLRTFIATFPGTPRDESRYAAEVVKHTGSEATYLGIDPFDIARNFEEILFQAEEARFLPGPQWLLYRAMRERSVRVSIEGHGSDELLAGYHYHARATASHDRIRKFHPSSTTGKSDFRTLFPATNEMLDDVSQYLMSTVFQVSQPSWLHVDPMALNLVGLDVDMPRLLGFDPLNQLLYFDFHYGRLPGILRTFDRISMAHGIEVRSPFMDWRVVCYGFSLSQPEAKIHNGFSKYILRESMRGRVPECVRLRKEKIGFISPMKDFFQGPMKSIVLDLINDSCFLRSDIWNGWMIRNLVQRAYEADDFNGTHALWRCIQSYLVMMLFEAQRKMVIHDE